MITAAVSSSSNSSGVSWIFLVLIVCAGLALWALVDVIRRPKEAFQAAGKSKTLWIVLLVGGFLFVGLIEGVVATIYLATVRPKVRAASMSAGL
ncbi:MAG: DUF2516 family protein [Acidimicrobiales bacterium]|jgi:hypothetical protein